MILNPAMAGDNAGVKIEAFEYVGTGTYGEENPTVWTFPFEPKLVFVQRADVVNVSQRMYIWGCTGGFATSTGYCTMSVSGNTLSFYGTNEGNQANTEGVPYAAVAIG